MIYSEFKRYAKELLNIALPIIMGNLGFILIGAGDVLIAGRHSTDTLAAISIANAISSCILSFGVSLVAAVSPVISNFRGEKKAAKKYFYPTIRFAMIMAFIMMLVILGVVPLIDRLGLEAHLVPMIKQYMTITAFATFGGYLHCAMKEYLQAFEVVFVPNLVTVFAVVLNIVLNIILVFGWGIIPSMGVVGLAVASLITRYFMGLVLFVYAKLIMNYTDTNEVKDYYKQLIKVGLPISFAVLIEFVAFNSVAIFMGRVAGVYAAAQNLVCTLTTVSFMVPFAISNAISVKVGYSNGARNLVDLKRYAFIGLGMSTVFMLCSSVVFALIPDVLVKLFTVDKNLIAISVPVIYVLACFQVFDGLQISLAGIFKGIKKTKVVMASNFVGYWLIAIPLGCTLAFVFNLKLVGFWISLVISSVILCSIMAVILFRNLRLMKKTFAQN